MALTQVSRGLLSTSIVDNGNATAITIDSSENVGIGTSSPSTYGVDGAEDLVIGQADGDHGLTISSFNSSNGTIAFSDVTNASVGRGFFDYDHNVDAMAVGTAGTERMRIDSSGNVGIGVTNPSNKFQVSDPSGGSIASFTNTTSADLSINLTSGVSLISPSTGILALGTSNTERMRIDSSGNVGIGTTSPTAFSGYLTVHQKNASGDAIHLVETDGGVISQTISTDGGGGKVLIGARSNHPTIFTQNDTERMRIDSSGNVGIGVTSVDAKLKVQAASGNTTFNCFNAGSGSQTYIAFNVSGGGTSTGSITTNGSTTAYNTSSDQRLKENIVNAPSASDDFDAIQVRSFDWKADGSHQKYGMVAQELQGVAPEAVSIPDDPNEMMGVDYSKLVPRLIKEIQSLRARVQQLENN